MLRAEQVTENETELAYVKVWLEDEQGNKNLLERKRVRANVTGNGRLEGFGTANPCSEEDYFADTVTTYDGYAMAAVRWMNPDSEEPVYIQFSADGCREVEIKIQIGGNRDGKK